MLTGHYDTVGIERSERVVLERHGQRQEDRVLAWFRASSHSAFTRQDVERSFGRACGTWRLRREEPEQGRLV